MKGYEDFFKGMDDQEWENFAMEVLNCRGFIIITRPSFGPDGGKDLIVERDNITYIVSCKHYINSGKNVGVNDEPSILDRIVQHNAQGFIGFYSTGVTSALQERLISLNEYGYECYALEKVDISNLMPKIPAQVLFKYGTNKNKFFKNVSDFEYKPLKCPICKKDILNDENIYNSIAGLVELTNGDIQFIWGCKPCLTRVRFVGDFWMEIHQLLHLKESIHVSNFIDELIENKNVAPNFWKAKNKFDNRIKQKMYPSNFGTWM